MVDCSAISSPSRSRIHGTPIRGSDSCAELRITCCAEHASRRAPSAPARPALPGEGCGTEIGCSTCRRIQQKLTSVHAPFYVHFGVTPTKVPNEQALE